VGKKGGGIGRVRWESAWAEFLLTQISAEITGSRIPDSFNFLDRLFGPRGKKQFLFFPTARQTAVSLQTLLNFILLEFPLVALAEYFNVLGDYANGR
jgi:hypothetical protein